MCGILGFCTKNKNILSNLNVDGIKDRGPDNIDKFENTQVGLYHSRLAIIDNKESSNQPLINKDYILICNGEIYNHKILKNELKFNFLTNSDCETIIGLYDTFGVDGFSQLDGMYSFALYDKIKNRLILHKDSIGKKPLFYYLDDKKIIFSSNITAIKENLEFKLTINKIQVEFYLKNQFINPKKTIFEEIVPVMSGEIITIDLDSFNIRTTKIKNQFDFSDVDFNSFKSIKDRLYTLIKQAIYKRIEGVSTPIVLFSGGIDSTIIALETLKYNSNTKLLSIKQPLPFLNDEPYVRQFAKKMNLDVKYVNILNFNFIKKINTFIGKLDQPLGVVAYYYLSALSNEAKGYENVLLTGDGADEIFYAYKDFNEWVDSKGSDNSLINCEHNFNLSKYGNFQSSIALLGHGFIKVDKSTAENQMEARSPFLDKELICFTRQIPESFWMGKDIKFILKEYLIDNGFSKEYVYRKKVGFAFPFRYLMIFKYPEIIKSIKDNIDLLHIYDKSIKIPSYSILYKRFSYYFNIYVLVKFLELNVKK